MRDPAPAGDRTRKATAKDPEPTSPATRPLDTPLPAKAPSAHVDHLDPVLVDRMAPVLRALRGYTRLKVEGLANVPKGPAILAANHTGWLGLDYALTAIVLHDETGRTPRGLVHDAWFSAPAVADFARRAGLSKVSKASMQEQLERGHLVMVFPEGEHGAFRAASGYNVLEFARGFVRVAATTGIPVVPVAILGGEEANPVDRTIATYESLLKMPIPIPRNLFPKPVKWRIRFLPAVDARQLGVTTPDDTDAVHRAAKEVRKQIQDALDDLLATRGDPYL